MTDPMPNLVEEPSAYDARKLQREQRRERRRLRAIEDEGLARATAQSDEDRALAKQVAMNRFSPSGRRVMSPAQATSKALRDMQAGSPAATPPGGASGFQSTGMDGKPGFQLRTEEERKARIAGSPLPTASSTPLSSVPDRPRTAMVPAPVAPAPAPTVTGMQAMAADAQSFRMTNQGMQGPPAALAAPKPMAPAMPPQAQPAPSAPPSMPKPGRSLSSLGAAPDDQTKKVRTPSGVSAARG